MVVSKGVDSDGELKMRDFSGIASLAEALKLNKRICSLECASFCPVLLCLFHAATSPSILLNRSGPDPVPCAKLSTPHNTH